MKRFTINNGPAIRFRTTILASLLGLIVNATNAQTTVQTSQTAPVSQRYSLRQCIDIALQNNLQIKQGQLNVQSSELQLRQSKLNLLPSINGYAGQSFSSGRNINPATNTFIESSVSSNNYQLQGQVTVFNGFALQKAIKQNDLFLQSTQMNLQAIQNNVSILVVQNYLNVLTYQEQLDIARRQVETTRGQLDRTTKLVNAGTLAEAQLYDLRAQVANDELTVVNAQNNLDLAKLALLQAMNVPAGNSGAPSPGTLEVEKYQLDDPTLEPYSATAQGVYETALQFMPDVKAAELRVRSDAEGVKVAKAQLFPTLSLSGSLSTLYSSVGRQKQFENGTTLVPLNVIMNGVQTTISVVQTAYRNENFTYGEQLNNNLNRGASLNLNVPIFGRFIARNRITNATITQKTSEINADNTRLTLRQNIETAYTNMLAGANRYRATQIQVESLEKAFQAAESRFNAGALNSVDYNIAKNNLDRSRANLVQAKFDYVFRTKILDFYQNKPLSF
ncbi:TolC family protein [Larkinella humicola]|uniref:TolC family protein n=1 Tax=Larkinella humicola TaxID=2607654 RepID=A0A5N1JBT1_9BACT|nr:TolC family protein [Larkinella humicola]KAA9349941.1 TolC family protein [Larkinella humicola]